MITISRECAIFLQRSLTPPRIGAVPEYVVNFERYTKELTTALGGEPQQGDGWVQVTEYHPLPINLTENDEVLLQWHQKANSYRGPLEPIAYRRASGEGE